MRTNIKEVSKMTTQLYEILDRFMLQEDLDKMLGVGNWKFWNVNNVIMKKFVNYTKLKFVGTIGRDFFDEDNKKV